MKLVIISFVLFAGIDAWGFDYGDDLYGEDADKVKATDKASFYNILNTDCHWQASSEGTFNTCDGGSVPRGFCGSGKNNDCNSEDSYREVNNKLKCCWAGINFNNFMEAAVDNKYHERDADNGRWVDCTNDNGILMGVCASSGNPGCLNFDTGRRWTTQGICANNKFVQIDENWCEELVGNYGEDMSCQKDFVVASICSSLGKGKCYGNVAGGYRKKGYAAIECCKASSKQFNW